MHHLIVYSHPNPKSFNHAILETFAGALKGLRHEVRVRDLYALCFDPVLTGEELKGLKEKNVPEDILIEQGHVQWADVMTFICPIWWGGMTAQLRGYLDRVFSLGFAYDETSQGLLTDKKVLTIHTIAAPAKVYEDTGLFASINLIYDEIIFKFCGLQVIGHKYFGFVSGCTDIQRREMLEEVKQLAQEIS